MRRYVALSAVFLFVASSVSAQQAPAPPKPGPEQQRLAPFVGNWTFEGVSKDGPMGPGGKLTGTDRITWLPGGFFVQRSFQGKSPMGDMSGIEILAYDAVKKTYTFTFFEGSGVMGSGVMTVSGNTWTANGTGQMGTMTMHQRCTLTFGAGNQTLAIKCDMSMDGKNWMPNFEGTATKTK
jgi:hypothetical protein